MYHIAKQLQEMYAEHRQDPDPKERDKLIQQLVDGLKPATGTPPPKPAAPPPPPKRGVRK